MVATTKYDLTLFSPTGFTGLSVAIYIAEHAPSDLKWALAGRSKVKVEEARQKVMKTGRWKEENVGIVIADSGNQESLDRMVSQTRVVISTVGPFAKYGTPLVEACVRLGADYVDITGEAPWIKTLINKYDEEAKNKGVVIVPSCGFDSVPSDLLAYLSEKALASSITSATPKPRIDVKVSVTQISGGISGGTLGSVAGLFEDGGVGELGADGYYLNDKKDKKGPDAWGWKSFFPLYYDFDFKAWQVPFFMEPSNSKIVRRSQSLLKNTKTFSYSETFSIRYLILALGFLSVLPWVALLAIPPIRKLIVKYIFPAPGKAFLAGSKTASFQMKAIASAKVNGKKVSSVATWNGPGDPGYAETCKYVAECGLALVYQRKDLDKLALSRGLVNAQGKLGGLLTPASAFGEVVVERIKAQGTGIEVKVLSKVL